MKKTLLVLGMVLILITGNVASVFADAIIPDTREAGYYVYVTTPDGGLNLRSNHNGSSDKVIQNPIADGTRLYIGRTYDGTWGFTVYNGYEGWVYLPQTTKETVAGYEVYVKTTDGGANMRKAPGAIYSKVINSPIADGTALYIDYTANGWGYTTYNGYEGWVALNQTTTTPPAAPSAQNPSVTQPADNSSVGEGIKTQDAPSAKTSENEQERAEEKKAVEQSMVNQIMLIAILVIFVIIIAVLMIIIINIKSKR